MSRYGGWNRDGISPYASQTDDQGIPQVTDEDYSYITSEDLERSTPRTYEPDNRHIPATLDDEDDDVLMIKHINASYPLIFPAFSIGDGKVYVQDVINRVALIMKLSDSRKRHIKMLYKGRPLKVLDKPIRDYGVKNNSELLLTLPEGKISDEDDEDGGSGSGSGEEVVVADTREERKARKIKKGNKGRKKKKTTTTTTRDQGSQRESASNLNTTDRDGDHKNGGRSPADDRSRHPSRISSPTVPAGPLEKLHAISDHFETQLLPLCREFLAKPPGDLKKRDDEYRKLSETVLQQVLLKLDEVDTGGEAEIRARRKELVNRVQEVLKHLDDKKPNGVQSKTTF